MKNSNPLLENTVLPPFQAILPEHVEPAIDIIIRENLETIEKLLDQNACTWESLVEPLESLDDRLSKAWSPVSHMNAVVNTESLRIEYNKCVPKLAEYSSKIGQNKRLYEAYKKIQQSEAFSWFNDAQRKVIENALRDFTLAGVALPEQEGKKFSELKQELSKLQSKFSDNVLDATDHWYILIEKAEDLAGLPEHLIQGAQERAQKKQQVGYRFGLDFPSYHAIMTYAQDRSLRKQLYDAYVTRASDQGVDAGKWDNSAIMEQILAKRHELAKLLSFKNYAEYSLATKMAKDPEVVLGFLEDLAEKAHRFATQEYENLKRYAKEHFNQTTLEAWDIAFYSEKLKKHHYDISQEELRAYFPESVVLSGLFTIVHKLYGMTVLRKEEVETWHPDVKFFEMFDEEGNLRGQFYMDLYARAHKRGGAWMDECRVRRKIAGEIQTPVAYLTCNFTAPIENKPALFTHDEVLTLFHEFGHGLHHLLTQIDYAPVSGINGVPWDAVELPSQFMENWCWEKEALQLISRHYETHQPLPDTLLDRLKSAKNFQAGLAVIRQLEFGIFDFRMHLEFASHQQNSIHALLTEVREKIGVIPVPVYNRFQHSFNHIFSGGYAAGYYSYLWAEVLSCDAFSLFEEEGIFNASIGRRFLKTILERGGSREPSDLFKSFRGREPSIDALLRNHGLVKAA